MREGNELTEIQSESAMPRSSDMLTPKTESGVST